VALAENKTQDAGAHGGRHRNARTYDIHPSRVSSGLSMEDEECDLLQGYPLMIPSDPKARKSGAPPR
jgi:hypothetical protein